MPSYYIPSEKKSQQQEELLAALQAKFADSLVESAIVSGEVAITIKKESVLAVFKELRDNAKFLFKQLMDIVAIDYPERDERFEVVYLLLSLDNNLRLRVKINIAEEFIVDSLSSIYSNSDWLEREVYDMFGIYFGEHKDLRRILTDFGFEGSPLRKDFPLSGFVEVEFNEELQRVVYKPVELNQAYREFTSENPWMGEAQVDTFNYLNKKAKAD
ncbi:MAG: NADH-quinone oxidoreductase subunit C [Alphaproteobacteria bacterium]|jgi:NADH-quinone oxidoreductase subunit C|nr:NADH-quinone oxidoreductase subunit C [Alphaproteobacteria bacterium]